MSNPINYRTFADLKRIVKENPAISDRKLAKTLYIDKSTVAKWRNRDSHPEDLLAGGPEKLSDVQEHQLKRENTQLKQRIAAILDQRMMGDKFSEITETIAAARIQVPKWHSKPRSKGKDTAIACTMASDWHLDETVYRSQVSGCNEFNRKIAEIRCGQYFDNVVQLCKKYIGGVKYDGLNLFLGGDMFSGNIHEELKETNEGTIIESLIYWTPIFVSGIRHLADNFGFVHISCVVGNHGRLTRKPAAKNRAQDNFDWLFYHMLAMQLKDDPRITWDISPAADCVVKTYDTTHLLTHGDQFRGGSGIAGLLSPLLLGDHRKRKRQAAVRQPYDWMVYGHWHSLVLGVRGLLGNGSLKGYDEYAYVSNFDYEPPQQMLWLVQEGVGVTGRWPVHVLGDDEKFD